VKTRSLVALGLALAVFLPPGITTYLIGALTQSLTGVYLMFYDSSIVDPSLLPFIILYMLFEGAILFTLVRQGASRPGWALTAVVFVNLLLGIVQYQSMLL